MIVGATVAWAHVNPDNGKPFRDLSGRVVSIGFERGMFYILVLKPDGTFEHSNALDLRVLDVAAASIPVPLPTAPPGAPIKTGLLRKKKEDGTP